MGSLRDHEGAGLDEELVYFCLGSNLGDRKANLEFGISGLKEAGVEIVRRSSLYETEPVELEDQPWFLNQVVAGRTSLPPRALLAACKRIEQAAGRREAVRFGPRVLDIDVILYKGMVVHEPELVIPHPRMLNRRFVLIPLLEIAPDIRDPETGVALAQVLAGLDEGKKVAKLKGNRF